MVVEDKVPSFSRLDLKNLGSDAQSAGFSYLILTYVYIRSHGKTTDRLDELDISPNISGCITNHRRTFGGGVSEIPCKLQSQRTST